jgi:hypothetical protein
MFNHGGVPNGNRDSLEPWFSRVFKGGVTQPKAAGKWEVSILRMDGSPFDWLGAGGGSRT